MAGPWNYSCIGQKSQNFSLVCSALVFKFLLCRWSYCCCWSCRGCVFCPDSIPTAVQLCHCYDKSHRMGNQSVPETSRILHKNLNLQSSPPCSYSAESIGMLNVVLVESETHRSSCLCCDFNFPESRKTWSLFRVTVLLQTMHLLRVYRDQNKHTKIYKRLLGPRSWLLPSGFLLRKALFCRRFPKCWMHNITRDGSVCETLKTPILQMIVLILFSVLLIQLCGGS